MTQKSGTSLSFKVMGYIFLILIVMLLLMGFFITNSTTKGITSLKKESNLHLAKSIQSQIDGFFSNTAKDFEINIAEFNDAYLYDSVMCSLYTDKVFSKLLEDNSNFVLGYFGSHKGQIYTYPNLNLDLDPRTRPWYQKAAEKGSAIWTDVYIDVVTNEPIISIAAPIYNEDDQLMGVVGADISLKQLEETIYKNFKINTNNLNETFYPILVDQFGVIAIHPDPEILGRNISEFLDLNRLLSEDEGYINYSYQGAQMGTFVSINSINGVFLISETKNNYMKISNDIKKNIVIIGSLMILILTILLYIFLRKFIIEPITLISTKLDYVTKGNLDTRIEFVRNDEIGLLANSFNTMIEQFRKIILNLTNLSVDINSYANNLTSITDRINYVTEQVTASIQQVATGAENQAQNVNEANRKVHNLSGQLKQIYEKNKILNSLVGDMNDSSDSGQEFMQINLNQMRTIKDTTQQVAQSIKNLINKSEQIDSILTIINGIANQTNLLALNAAIEAARAGDAGRGFAVVADEIRDLAQESAGSADKIRGLLEEIKVETQQASKNMENNVDAANQGNEIVLQTKDIFEKLIDIIQRVTSSLEEVANEIIFANEESTQVSSYVDNIAAVAEETSASTEEVAAASEEQASSLQQISGLIANLHSMVQNLKTLVDQFKL